MLKGGEGAEAVLGIQGMLAMAAALTLVLTNMAAFTLANYCLLCIGSISQSANM